MFMAGRLINGFGIGALVTCIPIYQAEVSTPESRGFMVSMHVSPSTVRSLKLIAQTLMVVAGRYVRHGLHPVRMAWFRRLLHLRQWIFIFFSVEVPNCVRLVICNFS